MPPRASRSTRSYSLQKKKVIINVYDLLPPGRLSSIVWTLGVSLLHSGVVINDKEYAFGGHDRRGLTGVYWTKPRTEPPGGTFRCEILHGFTYASDEEIEEIIRDVRRLL
jgi:deubiquitinase DESI2